MPQKVSQPTPQDSQKERPKAAYAFQVYCTMGYERSLPKLAEKLGHKPGYTPQLRRWAAKYKWDERVKKYDAAQIAKEAEEERKRLREQIIEMNDHHAEVGRLQLQRTVDILTKLADNEEINATTAVALLKTSVEMERQARGEGTLQKLQVSGPNDGPIIIETTWGTPKVDRGENA